MSDGGAATARTPEATVPVSPSGGGGRGAPAAGGDVDGSKFDELAGAVFEHCRQQLTNHGGGHDDDDESTFYPIAEQQQKRKLEQQLSSRLALATACLDNYCYYYTRLMASFLGQPG